MTAGKGQACPVDLCEKRTKPGYLMCWPHWRRVPKSLNRAVFDTFAAFQKNPGDPECRQAYRQARDAAIGAVEAKEMHEREIDA